MKALLKRLFRLLARKTGKKSIKKYYFDELRKAQNFRKVFTKENLKTIKENSEYIPPNLQLLQVLKDVTNKSTRILINDSLDDIDELIDDLYKKPKKVTDKIINAIKSDTNAVALSSSWLAYGTFIENNRNPNTGTISLTTKLGEKFHIENAKKNVWNHMVSVIGITTYNKGKRSKEFGAGTVLHRYYPPKFWKKGK